MHSVVNQFLSSHLLIAPLPKVPSDSVGLTLDVVSRKLYKIGAKVVVRVKLATYHHGMMIVKSNQVASLSLSRVDQRCSVKLKRRNIFYPKINTPNG